MANTVAPAAQFAGQALVRTASAIALNTATSYISRAFDTRSLEGPRLDTLHVQTSRDGAPMARVFGRVRLAGQVIWASHVRETSVESPVGGKGGGPTQTDYSYFISFAVGLCEGEIAGVDRIWANGAPLATSGLDMRVYTGSEEQLPDPIISATEDGEVPAFRGTAYIVFEDFPLADYGNRLPQLNVEVVRTGTRSGRLENLVQSVNLLPGSGEFSYATEGVEEGVSPGETRALNMNNLSGKPDIDLALDQLQAQLPNCRNVSIISSWFATSTDIATCAIRPGVERRVRNIRNATWQVGRDDRSSAHVVSVDDEDRPNFGGTPSDDSLIQTIQAIKARGMTVTLYPFILVDTPGFPWRGRMAGVASDVEAFFGASMASDFSLGAGPEHHKSVDDGFRNFILSHANLARRAGGVDRFIVGSEMVGLTTIRDAENTFPAVTELARLAGDVREILGADVDLTYAADWSEYFGFHPQDGTEDVFFHLDELWSHPAISAIGIDAYFPLSDWRDGEHLDSALAASSTDVNYLSNNIEGGEGYDWYYASDADRLSQFRTPITDWTYRYKDLRNWWGNIHRNKINGTLQTPTNWVPESKPFWLTEIGCPAVRFGANQPNLFSDGKSDESNIPYFSDGSRDDLVQRRYLESLIEYWNSPEINPVSNLTGASMIETSATSVWAWDARPFPDFPARQDIWTDGINWQTGHWINGRVGGVVLQDIVEDICAEAGLYNIDVSGVTGLVSGYVIDRPMRARDALLPLVNIYELTVSEQAGRVSFAQPNTEKPQPISYDTLIAKEGGSIGFSVEDNMSSLRDVRLTFIDASREYQTATLSARNELAETVRIGDFQAPIAMDEGQARRVVDRQLARSEPSRRVANLTVTPLAADALYPGAVVTLPDTQGLWMIDRLRQGLQTDVDLVGLPDGVALSVVAGIDPAVAQSPDWISEPVAVAFDMPGTEGLQVGALMTPFLTTELSLEGVTASVQSPVRIGALLSPLSRGQVTTWDRLSVFEMWMPSGAYFDVPESDVMAGDNHFAVETSLGWEVLGAAKVTLIAPETYQVRTLLRGLRNSDDNMVDVVPSGARVVALNSGLASLDVSPDYIGGSVDIAVQSSGRSGVSASLTYTAAHLRPLSVVHLYAAQEGDYTRVNWISRRLDGLDDIDPTASFEITWPEGAVIVTDNTAIIPVVYGLKTPVTVRPLHPLTSEGRAVEIIV